MEDWLDVRKSRDGFSAFVHAYRWTFDGRFRKSREQILLKDIPSLEEPFKIQELPLCPINFASEDVIEALRKRGRMFWKCRFKNYVSLHSELDDDMQNSVGSYFSFCECSMRNRLLTQPSRQILGSWSTLQLIGRCTVMTSRSADVHEPKRSWKPSTCRRTTRSSGTSSSCVYLRRYLVSICKRRNGVSTKQENLICFSKCLQFHSQSRRTLYQRRCVEYRSI